MAGASVKSRLQPILQTMNSLGLELGRGPGCVNIVLATKLQPLEKLREAHASGLQAFGENYLQEAKVKKEALSPLKISWHFIGKIQSNKVRDLIGEFDLIHSVGREKILETIRLHSERQGQIQDVLLQVNLFEEATKDGFDESSLKRVFLNANAYPSVRICGLMAFPPWTEEENLAREQFRRVKNVFDELKVLDKNGSFDTLSMGTSADYKAALMEGSNCLRLGTVLLGERN